jgi:hypothetical protein
LLGIIGPFSFAAEKREDQKKRDKNTLGMKRLADGRRTLCENGSVPLLLGSQHPVEVQLGKLEEKKDAA